MVTSEPPTIRRYTTLSSLLHLLNHKQITLLNPAFWDDRNNSYFINRFKEQNNLKSLLALCFTEAEETYHHWRVFAHGSDGVCIAFRKQDVLAAIDGAVGIRAKSVRYERIRNLKMLRPRTASLPFLKRHPYRDEKEFRIVYSSAAEEIETKSFPIDLACIRRVTLSPWIPPVLADSVKAAIRRLPGCDSFELYQTTLLENEHWKRAALMST